MADECIDDISEKFPEKEKIRRKASEKSGIKNIQKEVFFFLFLFLLPT
jgi:hypothetical protein